MEPSRFCPIQTRQTSNQLELEHLLLSCFRHYFAQLTRSRPSLSPLQFFRLQATLTDLVGPRSTSTQPGFSGPSMRRFSFGVPSLQSDFDRSTTISRVPMIHFGRSV